MEHYVIASVLKRHFCTGPHFYYAETSFSMEEMSSICVGTYQDPSRHFHQRPSRRLLGQADADKLQESNHMSQPVAPSSIVFGGALLTSPLLPCPALSTSCASLGCRQHDKAPRLAACPRLPCVHSLRGPAQDDLEVEPQQSSSCKQPAQPCKCPEARPGASSQVKYSRREARHEIIFSPQEPCPAGLLIHAPRPSILAGLFVIQTSPSTLFCDHVLPLTVLPHLPRLPSVVLP